ncbi:hypothetical protein BST27_25025 [Mycobacterium intermedium]|uniref:DUF58 domain-containing protein n=1 Tax=Mycobacterium intermedium TaxID=28445 RepID=A0A1E3S558_MYCIE|nr:DUF58 domain-containing protein [Mycobacterium intermedium]MCV6966401.1 DUF58 domain-containing protein [Mycobacterium intermedium]ODQ97230.1 hypothetical protein BHQ20_27255 [Mycobacterium intermedium]OPE46255.1 hypothetical protein BV508_26635 [Mycobacterium intermedium]ORA96568.1 hypothetical protein BST27_25025 [Mycobacterium intermedium]
MGKHLNRAKAHFGTDTRGLLEGGRYALTHTRSMEFDDLREYVPGDDVRDIDWKASARSGTVLIKRFVSEKHHKILLVADAGRNMAALAPSGEYKRDVAAHIMGAVGLIGLRRSDQIGMVYGDRRGSVNIPQRRGEPHIEGLLHRWYQHTVADPATSDITVQLDYVATHYRHTMLIIVVSDEPDFDEALSELLVKLGARHDILWAMVSDMPAVGPDNTDGFDVATGRFVLNGADLGPRVVDAYRRAEQARRDRLDTFLTRHTVPHATIAGSGDIRRELVGLTEVAARAG